MDEGTALALALARMMVGGDDTETLYDFLEVLVGKTKARAIVERVSDLPTSEENADRVRQAIARKRAGAGAPVEDVNALRKRVAELEKAARKNDELLEAFRAEREEERQRKRDGNQP